MGIARFAAGSPRWCLKSLRLLRVILIAGVCTAGAAWGANGTLMQEPSFRVASAGAPGEPLKATMRDEQTDSKQTPEQARSVYTNAGREHKAYLRASAEVIAFLGVSAAYYYDTLGDRKWYEFKVGEDSLRARFVTGDAYLLDNNPWETNVGHVVAGTGFYLLSRTNDLGLLQSLLITMAASTTWEMFGELQDEFSINDGIMTPIGGFATGEVMYQLGEFFQHSSQNIPNRALGFLFGPSAAIHRWLDCNPPKDPAHVDKFGFTTDAWHRFRVYVGGGASFSNDSDRDRTETELGFDFEVVTAEKYGKPGQVSMFDIDGMFNDLEFRTVLDGGEIVDLRFFARTAFLGYYLQNISKGETSQELEGHSLFVGLSSAFEYYAHQFSERQEEDKQAVCDLVGPSLISDYYHSGFHVRLGLEAYPTFSMVMPDTWQLYRDGHSLTHIKSVFRYERYYFALGATAAGRMEVDYGPWSLEGQARYYYFSSIDGLDRYEERVTDDIHLEDERLWLQLALYYALPIDSLKLALDAERLFRWNRIEDFSSDTDETRLTGRLVFEF